MSDELISLDDDAGVAAHRALDRPLGDERQRRYFRFAMAALGSVPWVGAILAAGSALSAERDQEGVNDLQRAWLEEHREKLLLLGRTLEQIGDRLEGLGSDIHRRMESPEYLDWLGRPSGPGTKADTEEKRELIKRLLMNAGGTSLCPDDLVRLFIQWIEQYHEARFAVIRVIYQNQGATRADIWSQLHPEEVRENSAEADLFKLLIRDLSTGSVVRQHRQTTADGRFVRKQPIRRPKGYPAARTLKSAFDDSEGYELTELAARG